MELKGDVAFASIMKDIKNKVFMPVYLLMGTEGYFIDKICDAIIENALTEEEKDFNFTQSYGIDTNVRELIANCKRFPMMSKYQLVVVKEAQLMDSPDTLVNYIERPLQSTILVVCCKNGKLKATETLKIAKKAKDVLVYESTEIKEWAVEKVISNLITAKGYKVDSKSVSMLNEFIGNDISRIMGEIEKLVIIAEKAKVITPEMVEKNIGISKDYNNFELETAIKSRNLSKAISIVSYFQQSPKNHPTAISSVMLFSLFSNMLLIQTSRDKSDATLMNRTGAKSAWHLNKIKEGCRYYSAMSCFNCIGYIRDFDRKCKGIGSRQNEYELMKELIYKIVNS